MQGDYIRRASEIAKDIDPTRPTSIAFAGYPSAGCQGEYGPLDIVGVNEYYGWYPGPGGKLFDRDGLSGYLDSVRRCYPRHAIVVTEFGAEANREGPAEEKGTWAFQQDFVNFHLGVLASKPWLSGGDLLGAQRVPGQARLGGRQPAPGAAGAPEGAADLRRDVAQARVGGRPAVLQRHEPVPVAVSASARAPGGVPGPAR